MHCNFWLNNVWDLYDWHRMFKQKWHCRWKLCSWIWSLLHVFVSWNLLMPLLCIKLINIYELILVGVWPHHVQMISETTYSSQTKFIGQSLPIREHGIGYSNLAFEPPKGQKRPIFSFKPLKRLEGLEIQS